MSKSIIIISIVFGLFIVCPRMAGMMHVINKNFEVVFWKITILGTIISIPILMLMVYIFANYGIWGTLIFCIVTDFGAAYLIKEVSINAAIETIVIAIFVIAGVKVAPFIVEWILPVFKT
ncbi:MAG: hypothetical protein FH762_08815 [Firmicutes bacterium]|nr:hypothetical protein [Bacillota bacterium]